MITEAYTLIAFHCALAPGTTAPVHVIYLGTFISLPLPSSLQPTLHPPFLLLLLLVVIRTCKVVLCQQLGKLMHYLQHHRWQLNLCVCVCVKVCSVVPGNTDKDRELNFQLLSVQWSDSWPAFVHFSFPFIFFSVICNYSIQINSGNRRCQKHTSTAATAFPSAGTIFHSQFQAGHTKATQANSTHCLCALPSSSLVVLPLSVTLTPSIPFRSEQTNRVP